MNEMKSSQIVESTEIIKPIKISMVKIEDLKEYGNNAKLHPQSQIDSIVNSMKMFGFMQPILIDEKNMIIAGHGRLYALKQLGIEEAPCIQSSHLSDEKKRAFIIADNETNMNSGWDKEKYAFEIQNIQEINMALFGCEVPEPGEVVDDNYTQDIPTIPTAKLGDVYELGNHRLVCGDSTKESDVKLLMNGKLADLCLTDPPYNVDYEGSDGQKIQNDNMTQQDFSLFLYKFYEQMRDSLKEGAGFYIFHADTSGGAFRSQLQKAGLTLRQNLVWVKNGIIMGRQDYQWQHEPILYGWKDGAGHYFINDRTQSTVFEERPNVNKMSKKAMQTMIKEFLADKQTTTIIHEDKTTKNDLHPTMKPLSLLGRLIKNSSKKEDIVLDLFGGSGANIIACEQLERVCYTMEYDPKYVDVIIDRWQKLTGKEAKQLK